MCLLENASHNLNLHVSCVLPCVALQECADIRLELLVCVVGIHQAQPQTICKGATHHTWARRGQLPAQLLLLGSVNTCTQSLFEVRAHQGTAHVTARRTEFDNEDWQNLLWPRDHIVL